jgi:acetyltransferase-like isoleucine patch superfamily enzyme
MHFLKAQLSIMKINSIKFFFIRILMKLRGYSNPEINAEKLRQKGIDIGEGTWIFSTAHIDRTKNAEIHIGKNCVLTGCSILAHDASLHLAYSVPPRFKPVYICDNCFIGWNAIILPGVTIGSDCVIGAGSVVAKDIPSGSIAIGNPARIIGRTIDLIAKRKSNPSY